MRRHAATAVALAVALTGAGLNATPAYATTGPYTLPFFDPNVGTSQPYGCTTEPAETYVGPDPVTNADPITYTCASPYRFHTGVDYDTDYKDVAASRDGTVVETYKQATGSTYPTSSRGNYVIIDHGGNRYTIYYHLKYGSITVKAPDHVYAGQKIAESGNTGNSSGPHLHYALMNKAREVPLVSQTLRPFGKWTTDPGRVPWLAERYSESSSSGEAICPGQAASHWVKFRNLGGRTWYRTTANPDETGRIIMRSTDSSGTAVVSSPFATSGWENSSLVGPVGESSVAPDAVGTWTFGLLGNGIQNNSYTAYFNLRPAYLPWFDHGAIDHYSIWIYILPVYECS